MICGLANGHSRPLPPRPGGAAGGAGWSGDPAMYLLLLLARGVAGCGNPGVASTGRSLGARCGSMRIGTASDSLGGASIDH